MCTEHGREGLPHVRGQGQRQEGATPRPRSGAVAKSVQGCDSTGAAKGIYSMPKAWTSAEMSNPTPKELIQGKEQRLFCWSSHEEIPHDQG